MSDQGVRSKTMANKDPTCIHLKACTQLSAVNSLPQLRLSIHSTLFHRRGGNFETKRQDIECTFCFHQYDKQFQGTACTLCKRELLFTTESSNGEDKTKKMKSDTVHPLTVKNKNISNAVEQCKRKKKRRKEMNAGLALPGQPILKESSRKPSGVLIPGQSGSRSEPARRTLVHHVQKKNKSEVRMQKEQTANHKKTLRKLLYKKKEEKMGSKLQDFLTLL
jgi:hypothetical protein